MCGAGTAHGSTRSHDDYGGHDSAPGGTTTAPIHPNHRMYAPLFGCIGCFKPQEIRRFRPIHPIHPMPGKDYGRDRISRRSPAGDGVSPRRIRRLRPALLTRPVKLELEDGSSTEICGGRWHVPDTRNGVGGMAGGSPLGVRNDRLPEASPEVHGAGASRTSVRIVEDPPQHSGGTSGILPL